MASCSERRISRRSFLFVSLSLCLGLVLRSERAAVGCLLVVEGPRRIKIGQVHAVVWDQLRAPSNFAQRALIARTEYRVLINFSGDWPDMLFVSLLSFWAVLSLLPCKHDSQGLVFPCLLFLVSLSFSSRDPLPLFFSSSVVSFCLLVFRLMLYAPAVSRRKSQTAKPQTTHPWPFLYLQWRNARRAGGGRREIGTRPVGLPQPQPRSNNHRS